MCGILVTNKNINELNISDTQLHSDVLKTLTNRGPDFTNIELINNKYYFIHTLLSMTGPVTKQPFTSDDGNVFCTFNGEIYNFKDFNDSYTTDGQCLIPLYEQYGENFISKLDGEFAIVLIDLKRNILIVSTDIFSTCPLRMALHNNVFGISTYKSCLDKINLPNSFQILANTTYVFDLNTMELLNQLPVHVFDLTQFKTSFDDWNAAFSNSIKKRTQFAKCGIYIGMSGGYDSGAIACELTNQNIDFTAYSIINAESIDTLNARKERVLDAELIHVTRDEFLQARRFLKENAEEYYLNIDNGEKERYLELIKNGHSQTSPEIQALHKIIKYRETGQLLTDDNGAIGCSYIASLARARNQKIYLSGSGADEIFSDYGFNKLKYFNHSTIGGYYPPDLATVFPWKNFYGNTQRAYLMKEEHVAGAYGIEGRYPFLDKDVVQEFLWLSADLKNSNYKSPLHNYLEHVHSFPYEHNNKTGFGCGFSGPTNDNKQYQKLNDHNINELRRGSVTTASGKVHVNIEELSLREFSTLEDYRIIKNEDIKHIQDNMYCVDNVRLNYPGDKYNVSPTTISFQEDQHPLPACRNHGNIANIGNGSYSMWTNNILYFSTSDNSDPRTNGREYSLINLDRQKTSSPNEEMTMLFNISSDCEIFFRNYFHQKLNLKGLSEGEVDDTLMDLYYSKHVDVSDLYSDPNFIDIENDSSIEIPHDNMYYDLATDVAKKKNIKVLNYIICDGAAGADKKYNNSKYYSKIIDQQLTVNFFIISNPLDLVRFKDSKLLMTRGLYQWAHIIFKGDILFIPAQCLEFSEKMDACRTEMTFPLPLYKHILCQGFRETQYYINKYKKLHGKYAEKHKLVKKPDYTPAPIQLNKFPTKHIKDVTINSNREYDICYAANGKATSKNIPLFSKFVDYIISHNIPYKILIICDNKIFDKYKDVKNITVITTSEGYNKTSATDMYRLLAQSRVNLTLSIWDNNPRTISESLATGCYNICFDQLYIGGYLIEENKTIPAGHIIDLNKFGLKDVNILQVADEDDFTSVWEYIVSHLQDINIQHTKIATYFQKKYSSEIEATNIVKYLI